MIQEAQMQVVQKVENYDHAGWRVVAESYEQVRAEAALIRVDYERKEGAFDLAAVKDKAIKPEEGLGGPADTAVGDFAGAFASATSKLDQLYSTPDQSHSMMEQHATTAAWNNDKLPIWTSNQSIAWAGGDRTQTLRMPKESIPAISPYIGWRLGKTK